MTQRSDDRVVPRLPVFPYSVTVQLLIGTQNPGKFTEIAQALADLPFTFLRPNHSLLATHSSLESGATFEANAIAKAEYFGTQSGHATVADDSGIIIEALQDELGVHTRRWGAGPDASDEEWIHFFLDRMRKEHNKRAHFVCLLAFRNRDGHTTTFEGRCSGVVTDMLEADYLPGLPISACFRPDGFSCVFSALKVDQKNSTSHRGRALALLRDHLRTLYLDQPVA